MANKKKTVKKTKKKNNKEKNKKSLKVVIIIACVVILLVALSLLLMFLKPKKISCTKKADNNGVLIHSNVVLNKNKKNIKNIVVTKKISIKTNDGQKNYLSAIVSSLEDNYKNKGIKYLIEEKSNQVVINLKYNKKEEYILDDLFIGIEEEGVSVNIMTEDRYDNYAKINLSKEYEDEDIIKILQKADYKCS